MTFRCVICDRNINGDSIYTPSSSSIPHKFYGDICDECEEAHQDLMSDFFIEDELEEDNE